MTCELCGADSFEVIVESGPYLLHGERVVKCKCGLMFLNPRMSNLGTFYETYNQKPQYQESDETARQNAAVRYAQLFQLEPFSVLEIGCGTGYLAELFKKGGAKVAAMEVRNRVRADIPVYDDVPPGYFDLILMVHVLEHLPTPVESLSQLHVSGKRLYVEIPAYDLARIHKAYHHSAHLFDFTTDTVKKILKKAGWIPVKEYRYKGKPNREKWFGLLCEGL